MSGSPKETEENGIEVHSKIFNILILGIVLVFVGIAILLVVSLVFGGSGSFGGVILIGPIPIVFGSGPNAIWLILIGVILTAISVVLFFIMNRRINRSGD